MKKGIRVAVPVLVFAILSFLISVQPEDFLMNTIYTVSGIMFSIGLGLVTTFNMQGVKNPSFVNRIRKNLANVRDTYLIYFVVSTFGYIIGTYLGDTFSELAFYVKTVKFKFNLSFFILCLLLYSIAYYIINFFAIQRLTHDIFDKLNKEY